MAREQLYGIKYPFTNESWRKSYVDLNDTEEDKIKSEIMHVIFTPKGQRLRMPDFGSDLIKYIYEPNDSDTWTNMKNDIRQQISAYVPNVSFRDISVYQDENNEHALFAIITYSVKHGLQETEYKMTVPIV